MNDLVSRQMVIDAIMGEPPEARYPVYYAGLIRSLPAKKPEPLTDAEQRIFLAAMERELKVCEEIDSETVREAYETSLVKVCKEIKRKVMGALWT